MSTGQFADLGVSDAVVAALARRRITEPFPIQGLVIGDILAGRDVLAKSPTGSGKTLAFAIPLADAAGGVRTLAERARIVGEGAAGLPVAAALAGLGGDGRVVCIVSGGNIDSSRLATILEGGVPD